MRRIAVALGVVVACVAGVRLFAEATTQKVEEAQKDPRRVVEAYLGAALAGRVEEAMALGEPGKSPSRKKAVENLKSLGLKQVVMGKVYADAEEGIAITEPVSVNGGPRRPLIVWVLIRDGRWMIHEVSMDTEAKAEELRKAWLIGHRDAKEIKGKE
jgi:hypothetical protein